MEGWTRRTWRADCRWEGRDEDGVVVADEKAQRIRARSALSGNWVSFYLKVLLSKSWLKLVQSRTSALMTDISSCLLKIHPPIATRFFSLQPSPERNLFKHGGFEHARSAVAQDANLIPPCAALLYACKTTPSATSIYRRNHFVQTSALNTAW